MGDMTIEEKMARVIFSVINGTFDHVPWGPAYEHDREIWEEAAKEALAVVADKLNELSAAADAAEQELAITCDALRRLEQLDVAHVVVFMDEDGGEKMWEHQSIAKQTLLKLNDPDGDIIQHLRDEIVRIRSSADYHKSQECMRIQNELVTERDRLREALQKIGDHNKHGLLEVRDIARAALAPVEKEAGDEG